MKRNTEGRISQLVVATGIASVVSQLLIIREFLSQFQGNEFVIALILFSWLMLGGVGTWGARISGRKILAPNIRNLAWLSMLLAVLSPMTLLGARLIRDVVFIPGSAVGFYAAFGYIFAVLAPYGLLLGFLLPFSLMCARVIDPGFSGTRLYITDNIGDVSGGALFSFVLVFVATPLQAMFFANTLLLTAAFFLFPSKQRISPPALLPALIALTILFAATAVERPSLKRHTGNLVHYEESRYGRIEIHRQGLQHTLFLDGRPVFSDQNLILAEEIVHYPLSQIAPVNSILLISAEGGMMDEIEKYHPAAVDYVEIDPAVTGALLKYGMIREIPGLNIVHRDGRTFLNNTDTRYDAVIVNLPEPDTFQINRFFTESFFRSVRDRLTDKGIFCFHIEAVGNYISDTQRQKISILRQTASQVFSHLLILPGERLYFLCADFPLNSDIPELLDARNLQTLYIKGYFHGNVTPERIAELNSPLTPEARVNTDYLPRIVGVMFSQWFSKFHSNPTIFMALLTAGVAAYLIRSAREEFVLFTTGAMTMGSELLVIFAFQVFFGYIYFQIGLIVTVFLAGLLPGAIVGEYYKHRGRNLFLLTDGLLMITLTIFIGAILGFGDLLPLGTFLIFGGVISFACGIQFPVALHLGGPQNPMAIRAFSADLIGAAVGTLVTSVVLMPYVGLIWTAAALIAMKIISFGFVLSGHE